MSSNTNEPLLNISAFYAQQMAKCDGLNGGTTKNEEAELKFWAMTPLSLVGITAHLLTMPITLAMSRHRSAYFILFNISICNMLWLSNWLWICIEYHAGQRIIVPFNLDFYLHTTLNEGLPHLYILLAINRTIALTFVMHYNRIFKMRNLRCYVLVAWLLALAYCIWHCWQPEQRGFHCLNALNMSYFITNRIRADQTPVKNLAVKVIVYVRSLTPDVLYCFCVCKLVVDRFVKGKNNSITPEVPLPTNDDARKQFDDLMSERIRLFIICLVGSMPSNLTYVVSNTALYSLTQHANLSSDMVDHIALTFINVQQPFVMLALSYDYRAAFRQSWCRIWRGGNGTSSGAIVAWN